MFGSSVYIYDLIAGIEKLESFITKTFDNFKNINLFCEKLYMRHHVVEHKRKHGLLDDLDFSLGNIYRFVAKTF